jgi:hypothetical protein
VFTAADPYVLGIGFAAWRDVGAFFKECRGRRCRHSESGSRRKSRTASRAASRKSGNYLRAWLHLGFNQDEAGAMVHDGMWPIIAGRRISLELALGAARRRARAVPGGQRGAAVVASAPDPVRGLPSAGNPRSLHGKQDLPEDDRALRLGRSVGAEADAGMGRAPTARPICRCPTPCAATTSRAPITAAARAASTTSLPGVGLPKDRRFLPGNNYGSACCRESGAAHATVNAIRVHFRDWVMKGTPPPPSRYPTLAQNLLADANKQAIGFPTLPGLRATVPSRTSSTRCSTTTSARIQLRRWLRHPVDRAAEGQAGAEDGCAESRCGRQRTGRRPGRAARCAARHLSRLEHHRRRRHAVPQGPALRLRSAG